MKRSIEFDLVGNSISSSSCNLSSISEIMGVCFIELFSNFKANSSWLNCSWAIWESVLISLISYFMEFISSWRSWIVVWAFCVLNISEILV